MKKSLYLVTLLVLVAVFAMVDPALAQVPPPPPPSPSQSPIGITWLVLMSGFAMGIFALRKKK